MRNFKIGCKTVTFLCILEILIIICNDWVTEPAYTRLMLHELYEPDEKYTMAFLGASHTYQSFNPAIFDNQLGECYSINLGSSGQSLAGTYFMLKEFLRLNSPNTVIMEISYPSFEKDLYERTAVTEYALFDYMRPSINKLCYFFNIFSPEDYANALFPVYRNRSKFEVSKVKENYKKKLETGYYKYKPFGHVDGWNYLERGFVAVDWSYENMGFEVNTPYKWDENLIIPDNIEYLKKIFSLCTSKGIDIIAVTAPVPIYAAIQMQNYESVHDYFAEVANACNVEYYDFNYCKADALKRNDNLYFYDSGHMNKIGALEFSNVVCTILKQRAEETFDYEEYFYLSYDEMVTECQSGSIYNF